MGKLWAIIKREFVERVRSKWFLIATILGPLFFGGITVGSILLQVKSRPSTDYTRIVILDATGTDLGQRVRSALGGGMTGDTASAQVRVVPPAQLAAAESASVADVMANRTRGYLVLDSATTAGKSARYGGRNASSLLDVQRLETAVRTSVLAQRLERRGLDPREITALTSVRPNLTAERITDKGKQGSGMANTIFGYIVAFLLYTMIVIYGQVILRGVMEEKTTRVAEVVVSSVPTNTLLAGKVLGVGAVSILQQLLWLLGSFAVYKARQPLLAKFGVPGGGAIQLPHVALDVAIMLVLFYILGYLFYASLFAAIGAMVNSQEDVQQASMPVMLMLVASVIFISPTMLNPMSTLAKTMSRLPFSAPILMPLRMTMVSLPWYEIAGTILGLILACVLAIWLAARIYRVGLLMYGKRPTMRELVRWVRYAH
jgi:ABC-2 type transport system permease protein